MRSLLATLLAISTGTLTLPAIANANDYGASSISQGTVNELTGTLTETKLALNVKPTQATSANAGSLFAQGSLKIAKQIPAEAIGLLVFNVNPLSWQISATFSAETSNRLLAINKLLSFLSSSQYAIAKEIPLWLGTEVAIAVSINPNPKEGVMVAALAPINDDKQFEIFAKKLPDIYPRKPTEILYQGVQILEWQLQDGEGETKQESVNKLSLCNTELSLLKQAKPSKPNQPNCGEMPSTEAKEPPAITYKPQPKPSTKPIPDAPAEEMPPTEITEPNFPNFGFKRLAIAKLPSGYAVIATDRQAIQKMIDLSVANSNPKDANSPQPLPSLAEQPLFLRSLNNPLWNRSLLAGYGDFKGIGQLSEYLAADLPETSEIPGFSRAEYIQSLKYTLSQYNSFDLFAWLTPQGVRSQSNSYFSEVRSPLPKDQEPRDRLLSYLPSNIYGAITSRNLNRQWQWFVEESKVQSTYKIFVEGLRMIKPLIVGAGLDLDIEKDVISWMDGEYAFVAFPSALSPFKDAGMDLALGMLIRTSKPEVANATLDKLTKYISRLSKDFIQVKKRQVGSVLMTSFEFPDHEDWRGTPSFFAYGWRDRQTLMLVSGSAIASAFVPTAKPSLAESEMFREAIADMPQPNFGYFYLNVNAIAQQVAKFYVVATSIYNPETPKSPINTEIPEPIQKQIDKLGGAVFVYSETSDRFQADFFLGLKQ
ncbi:MAG: DUF3352 domain-containing protein [Pseudanabaena sp. ELA645]|jgi:hypothetical protein